MGDQEDIASARGRFAAAFAGSGMVPSSVDITIHPAHGEATAFHCTWPLTEHGVDPKKNSREITVKVASAAIKAFRSENAKGREAMLTRFIKVIGIRLHEGKYDEAAATLEPFIVFIDEHSLD